MRVKAGTKAGAALAVLLAGLLLLLGMRAGQPVLSAKPRPTPTVSRKPRPTPVVAAKPRTTPIPLAPAHGTLPGWLHTDGTRIVDAQNHPIRLASVNWYGAEGPTFVPGGLDRRPYLDILRTIKSLGFNSIRYTFSNQLVETNPVVRRHVDANPAFRGKRALDIMDTILAGARQVGLMVILADMSPGVLAGAHAYGPASALWYQPPHYTRQRWIDDWVSLARRYRANPAVVGFDLHNEPHSNGPGLEVVGLGYLRQGATWGPFQGRDNAATDWRLAAEQAGNATLRVNPHVLIIVEGVEVYPYPNPLRGDLCPYHIPATNGYCADVYWWGGNLQGVQQYPVVLAVPHQLVYSPHEYGPSLHDQRWTTPRMTERDWQSEMSRHWGYLLAARGPNAAPLWVGEFGTNTASNLGVRHPRGDSQDAWFRALIDYLQRQRPIGWAYWALNGTYPGGSRRESYGLLSQDWRHISNRQLFESLRGIQR